MVPARAVVPLVTKTVCVCVWGGIKGRLTDRLFIDTVGPVTDTVLSLLITHYRVLVFKYCVYF